MGVSLSRQCGFLGCALLSGPETGACYGWQTWSVTVTVEHMLRVLGRILGSDRKEVSVDWGKLHNQELRRSCCSPNISMAIR
jgi:hypothetical protein